MGDTILIEHPERQKPLARAFFAVITALLWLGWTYLWLPVMPYVGQLLNLDTPYQDFIPRGYQSLADVLPIYALVIATMGGSLIGWAFYNYARFHGVERRHAPVSVSPEDLTSVTALALYEIVAWQASRRLVVAHDHTGRATRAV